MQDLTQGSIPRHVLTMAAPIAAGMLLQTLYYVVDLWFVAQLGDAPIAGVSATSPVMFVVFALTQILGVGTVALMSHAVGRKDRADANHVFNQSVALAAPCAAATLAGGVFGAGPFPPERAVRRTQSGYHARGTQYFALALGTPYTALARARRSEVGATLEAPFWVLSRRTKYGAQAQSRAYPPPGSPFVPRSLCLVRRS